MRVPLTAYRDCRSDWRSRHWCAGLKRITAYRIVISQFSGRHACVYSKNVDWAWGLFVKARYRTAG